VAEADELRLEQEVAAPPARVWEALIRPALWWNDGVTLEPAIGGQFFEPWTEGGVAHRTFGIITAFEPPHRLAMTWKDEDWAFETEVTITIAAQQNKTLVSLRHHGWDAAPAEERDRLIAGHRSGWSRHLKSLAACAESMIEKG
jgi:uncharacterized protein YndB with AHSA1/START domain